MKIVLVAINAKYIHSNLAVYSLKASVPEYEDKITLIECTVNQQPEEIFSMIFREQPKLLFFSCYIWNRELVLETAENVKKVLPETKIWAGGPEVSWEPAGFLKENLQFDGLMRGEGEKTFAKLLQYYETGGVRLEDIPGLAFRRDAGGQEETRKISETGPALLPDLDELPFVYRGLMGEEAPFENRILYYESSRGCPFGCSYCLSSVEKGVRFRRIELVEEELSFFLEKKVKQVKFVDRTFNCSPSRTVRIWKYLQKHDNGITNFHFEISGDLLTEEEITVLSAMRPGLAQLEIGVQSVNEKTLEAIGRQAFFDKIQEPVRRIAKTGRVHQHLDLIAGLPWEDMESFADSFNQVYGLHPQELQLGFLKVLKGSPLYRETEKYGIIYRSRPPYEVLQTKWMTCEELLKLKEIEEVLEIYYNSGQYRFTMRALEKSFPSPFSMYENLAEYRKRHTEPGRKYSRLQRMELLRGFALLKGREPGQLYEELLVFDLYLREKAKSRPFWKETDADEREKAAEFYKKEAEERKYLPEYRERRWKQLMHMTHLEHFHFDVLGKGERKDSWILFDYGRRNPLTYDAKIYEIGEQISLL